MAGGDSGSRSGRSKGRKSASPVRSVSSETVHESTSHDDVEEGEVRGDQASGLGLNDSAEGSSAGDGNLTVSSKRGYSGSKSSKKGAKHEDEPPSWLKGLMMFNQKQNQLMMQTLVSSIESKLSTPAAPSKHTVSVPPPEQEEEEDIDETGQGDQGRQEVASVGARTELNVHAEGSESYLGSENEFEHLSRQAKTAQSRKFLYMAANSLPKRVGEQVKPGTSILA